jgi:bacteriocin biosynthesis cyclodehydratase domain-containing protein
MLSPGIRLVERPGVLHFFDGRRVVSLRGDDQARSALRAAATGTPGASPDAVRDARKVLGELNLTSTGSGGDHASDDGPEAPCTAAVFASAAVAGWVSPRAADERLRDRQVYVWGDTDGELRRVLAASNVRCTALAEPDAIAALDPEQALLVAVLPDQQAASTLLDLNRRCLARRLTWLPVGSYDGAALRVGPLMIPGQTACADCLVRRLAANVEYAALYRDMADAPAGPTPPVLRMWAYATAGLLLLHWVATRDAAVPGRLVTLLPDTLTVRHAEVFRVPRCRVCAAPDSVLASAPWELSRDH